MPLLPSVPRWAYDNPIDPISGLTAITEPSTSKKASGFNRLERPPRQDFNWLFNANGIYLDALNKTLRDFINGFRIMDMPHPFPDYGVLFSHGMAADSSLQMIFDTREDQFDGGAWPDTGVYKQITASFSPGTDRGGLSSSLVLTNGTWYHNFVIRLSSGDIDVGFDTDPEAANLIADHGVTHYRRISSSLHQTGGMTRTYQIGNRFILRSPATGTVSATIAGGTQTGTNPGQLFTPLGFSCIGLFNVVPTLSSGASQPVSYITCYGDLQLPGIPNNFQHTLNIIGVPPSGQGLPGTVSILQDGTNNTIAARSDVNAVAGISVNFSLVEYIDTRGSDWGSGPSASDYPGKFF